MESTPGLYSPPHGRRPTLWRFRPLALIVHYLEIIMSTQAQAAQTLRDVLAREQKTAGEIQTLQTGVTDLKSQIAELQAQVADGGEVTPELQQAIDDVAAQAQVIDDLIPDVAPAPGSGSPAEG